MSQDLDSQIRRLAERLVDDLPKFDAELIVAEAEGIPVIGRSGGVDHRRLKWLVPTLSLTLFAAFFAGVVLLLSRSQNVADQVTPTTLATGPSTPSTVGEDDDFTPTTLQKQPGQVGLVTGLSWERLSLDEMDPPGESGFTSLIGAGDRFVYIDQATRTLSESFDGLNWATQPLDLDTGQWGMEFVALGDTVLGSDCVGWVGPEDGSITSLPGCVTLFDGTTHNVNVDAHITASAVSPAGIVLVGWPLHDDSGSAYLEEDDLIWNVTGYDITEVGAMEYADGVLTVETPAGLQEYRLADLGYAYWDENRTQAAWYTTDGVDWTPIPDFPQGVEWKIVGTGQGFLAVSDDRDGTLFAYHSDDGRHWEKLGDQLPFRSIDSVVAWEDAALIQDGNDLWLMEGDGIHAISQTFEPTPFVAAGGAGIVAVANDSILYSTNGEGWLDVMPTEMSQDLADGWGGTLPFYSQPVQVAVIDNAVIIRFAGGGQEATGDESLWYLGIPDTG